MEEGERNRSTGSTALNVSSSRSHSVTTVVVEGRDVDTGEGYRAKLQLVDLAGSERVSHSQVEGERLKEAQYINRSLSSLGDVVSALQNKNQHVPYRNSRLTQVPRSAVAHHALTALSGACGAQRGVPNNSAAVSICHEDPHGVLIHTAHPGWRSQPPPHA
jgi:kinesin family protein C2/C3